MIFGQTQLERAEGAILAHSLKLTSKTFKKGRVLSAEDLDTLRDAGIASVVAARLEKDDVHEDRAATAIAEALAGPGVSVSAAFTGRCNLIAEARGVLVVDRGRLDRLNLVHESVTVATLSPYEVVEPRQMAATVKIIPFSVPGKMLDRCLEIVSEEREPLVRVAEFRPRRAGLVQTRLPGMKESILDKTRQAIDARLAALGCPPSQEIRCDHAEQSVAEAVRALRRTGCELVLISGASAIVDRNDVVPAGIVGAGGEIEHFGMPVDPGNLILLARDGEAPVLGLPGCARSPKLNGFDWVLQRLVAGVPVTARDVMLMGAGGLLTEIGSRPLPRAAAVETGAAETAVEQRQAPRAPRLAALVLAAGQSRRMGTANKLLAAVDGIAMVRRVVEQARASRAEPVIVVTGHERERVESALAGLDVTCLYNPDYDAGLSTSLHRGLAALPAEIDGAVVCLGDMPRVTVGTIDKLIAAFNPVEGRAICVPTWRGKRGNPVLFARRFFAEMQTLSGDVGARHLIGQYPEALCEVAMPDDGVLLDIDTPEALTALQAAG